MPYSVRTILKDQYEESALNVDTAIARGCTALGESGFDEMYAMAEQVYQAWLKAADAWIGHLIFCEDCRECRQDSSSALPS
jgi:hypothetical protein